MNKEQQLLDKERYKYTPDIDQIADFEDFSVLKKDIDAQKTICTETESGYLINVPEKEIIQGITTINLHYTANGNFKVENNVILAANSFLRLVIYHHSAENVRVKESLTVELNAGARLEVIELVDTRSILISNLNVTSKKDSRLTITTLDVNNQCVVRNQCVNLEEPGAECSLNGLYLTAGQEHVDNYIRVTHAADHCTSNQLYKGVLGDKSEGAFTGHILVAKDAQKTAAYQQNHNILLSDFAKVNSRPQLEIYADDVKCNHGATVGRLDPEAIYYMRQRGIPTEVARRLQLTGFAEDVVKFYDFGDMQSIIQKKIEAKLATI